MKKSAHFEKVIKIYARKLERSSQVDYQLCSRKKLLWTKPLSGTHQISAKQSLAFIRSSSVPTQCVKICQQGCTQDGRLIPICKNSRLDITDLAILRTCPCVITKKQDKNAEFRASTHLEIRKIWSYGMILTFLSLLGNSSIVEWWKFWERKQKTRDGWFEREIYSRKRIQNRIDVEMWVVAKLQNERKN